MFIWKLELKERTDITQGVWDKFCCLPIAPQSLYSYCWDPLARATSTGQSRAIWSGTASCEPGRRRPGRPPSRQGRALILVRRRQQCDVSITMPVCNTQISNDPEGHKVSINGFTSNDLEVIVPSLTFLSSCIVIFGFFAGFIYHWPSHAGFCSLFLCVELAPVIDTISCVTTRYCGGVTLAGCQVASQLPLNPPLQQDRGRK